MTLSIPKTGSATVKLMKGSLVLWYQRSIRMWTLQQLNEAGDQIGPVHMGHGCYNSEASYHHNRQDAVDEMEEIVLAEQVALSQKICAEVVAEENFIEEVKDVAIFARINLGEIQVAELLESALARFEAARQR